VISRRAVVMIAYVALIGVTYGLFKAVPGGFVPARTSNISSASHSFPMAPRWTGPKR